jgi:ankyrin repeat protein
MGWKVMLACREGNFKTALQLIRDGVNPNLSRDEDGWSPLHYACKEGNLHFIVTLVQKYGCDLEYQTLHTRREGDCIIRAGSTPLHVACRYVERCENRICMVPVIQRSRTVYAAL